MTKLTQAAAVAIATAAKQIRPDWDHPGILHALRTEADRGTQAEDAFIALANLCGNTEARTPGLLNKPGTWWQKPAGRIERRGDHNVKCPDHPEHDMPHDHGGDMTAEEVSAFIAANITPRITPGPKPRNPAPPAPVRDLNEARAQLDQETP